MAAVWDEKSLVDSYENVEVDDHDLNGEVENVEACFALVVGWVGNWPFTTCVVGSDAERCTCA